MIVQTRLLYSSMSSDYEGIGWMTAPLTLGTCALQRWRSARGSC